MPFPPKVPCVDIYNALKDLHIFDDQRKLKKSSQPVWKTVALQLGMREISLYLFVQKNRNNIQDDLRAYKYQKFENLHPQIVSNPYHMSILKEEKNDDQEKGLINTEKSENLISDQFQPLAKMIDDVRYYSVIQKLSIKPFYIIWWSSAQIDVYKDLAKTDATFSFLVLNGLMKNCKLKNSYTGDLCYFVLACSFQSNTIGIAQAAASGIDEQCIEDFCLEFLKNKVPCLRLIHVPLCKNILNAISISMNRISFLEYLLKCYQYMVKITEKLPVTIICIDVYTIIKVLQMAKSFKNQSHALKKFYSKCFIYLSIVKDKQDFEEAVINMLTLLLNPNETEKTTISRNILIKYVKSNAVSDSYKEWENLFVSTENSKYLQTIGEDNFSMHDIDQNILTNYIDSLKLRSFANSSDASHAINAFYCEELYDEVIQISLIAFPSWTRILNGITDNVTISNSFTCATKNYLSLLEDKNPSSVSEFLIADVEQAHLNTQKGRTFINDKKNNCKIKKLPLMDFSCLNQEENWKGRVSGQNNHTDEADQIFESEVKMTKNANIKSDFPEEPMDTDSSSIDILLGNANSTPNQSSCTHPSPQDSISSPIIQDNFLSEPVIETTPNLLLDFDLQMKDSEKNEIELDQQVDYNKENEQHLSKSFLLDHNYLSSEKTEKVARILTEWKESKKLEEHKKYEERYVKKSKYLAPCPSMKICHQQTADKLKGKRKESLIRNANCMAPRLINKKKCVFVNSSAFDSIVEVMCFSYKSFKSYRDFCNDSNCVTCSEHCLMKIVMSFCSTGNINALYSARAHLLSQCGYLKDDFISITDTIGVLFSKLMEQHFSLSVNVYCFDCEDIDVKDFHCSINLAIKSPESIKNLDSILMKHFNQYVYICEKCESHQWHSLSFKSYLMINLTNNQFESLSLIPSELILKSLSENSCESLEFILTGVIGLEESELYVAYCRSSEGFWNKRSGTLKKIEGLSASKLSRNKINIKMLMYVKISNKCSE